MGGKQKVVVSMPAMACCDKGRSIALQTVARLPGLSSVSLEGAENDRVVVTGEEIDVYGLMKSLKKKVGCVKLLTVGPVEEKPSPKPPQVSKGKEPEKKPIESTSVLCLCQSVPCFCQTVPCLCHQEQVMYVCELCNPEPTCVVM